MSRSRCRLARIVPHNHVLHGVWIPPGKGQFWGWANMGMPSWFTKGHGSLGKRWGRLSNYFEILSVGSKTFFLDIYTGETLSFASIQASVIRGQGLGTALLLVTAANLQALHIDNKIIKYANDVYFIVPVCNTNTCLVELEHIRDWGTKNNLKLNSAKSKEILFRANIHAGNHVHLPPPCQDIKKVTSMVALRVVDQTATNQPAGCWSRVHGCCMHCVFCEIAVCRHHQCMTYSNQPYLPSCYTVHLFGLASAQHQTEVDWMRSCVDARDCNTVMTIRRTSLTS